MTEKNMELSSKECEELVEKINIVQNLLEEEQETDDEFQKLLENRIILINDIISDYTIDKIVMPLIEMDNDGTNEKITIYLNTDGGDVSSGLLLCDIIERLKTPTEVIVLARAYSMGSLILMAGYNNPNVTRKCYSFSTALLHGGSTLVSGTSSQVKDYFQFNERYENRITEYIVSHTNLTKEDYAAIERYESYMDSDEMLEKGLVDEIL